MAINTDIADGDVTHHIKLTDYEDTKLGLICCDRRGNRLARVGVDPYPSFASQLRQGRGKHADRVPPFEDIPLSDFSGGMAMLHHDEDASRYLDGKRIDTSREGEVIHGGLETYTTGLRDFDENWPGDVNWLSLDNQGANRSTTFVAGASYDVNSIVVILKKVGAPTGNITVLLLAEGGGVLRSKVLTVGTDLLTDLVSERVEFVFSSVQTINAGTTYKVKVAYSGSSSDYVDVAIESGGNLYYRVLDDTGDFDGIFFELNGGFYFVKQPLDKTVSKVYLYGERGVADSNDGNLDRLIDASKTWADNKWNGGVVKIIAEDGTEEREPYRTIVDTFNNNDDPYLTVTPDWNIKHTTETEYVILYPEWQLVQTLDKYCTDVAVGKYFAIFMLDGAGVYRYVVKEVGGAYSEQLYGPGNYATIKGLITTGDLYNDRFDGGVFWDINTNTSSARMIRRTLNGDGINNIHGLLGGLLDEPLPFSSTEIANITSYIENGRIFFNMTGGIDGDLGHLELPSPIDIRGSRYIEFMFYTAGALDAGDLQFGFADSDGNRKNINLPAITSGVIAYCSLEISPAPGSNANSYDPTDITDIYIKSTKSINQNFQFYGYRPSIQLRTHGITGEKLYFFPRNTQVNNIIEYAGGAGEAERRPWIFTWKGPWYKTGDTFTRLYLKELEELEHPDNGKGVTVNDVYLYFNLGKTIQRYYSGHLDSVGPDADYGLPEERIGIPISMASYPGKVFAAIDAGVSGVSSVIYRKSHGWHEAYRAWENERIRKIHILARADTVDQLFVLEGADVLWVPISINAQTDTDYEYVWESVLETSRIYGGLRETEKYYHAITLVTEDLTGTDQYFEVDYRTSESSTWANVGAFNTSPRQRRALISTNNVSGRWIQFRLRSYTTNRTKTPVLVSAILDALERLDVNNMYSYTVRIKEGTELDMAGVLETQTGVEKLTQLETWIDSPLPLTLNTTSKFEDGKLVFIEGARKRVLYSKVDDKEQEVRIIDLTLIEVQ